MQVFAPPNPDLDELYIPPLDDLEYFGLYPSYTPLDAKRFKRAMQKKDKKRPKETEVLIPFGFTNDTQLPLPSSELFSEILEDSIKSKKRKKDSIVEKPDQPTESPGIDETDGKKPKKGKKEKKERKQKKPKKPTPVQKEKAKEEKEKGKPKKPVKSKCMI